MSWPEDAARPAVAAPTAPMRPPSAALGYLLNVVLPGAGFTLIGRWGWHMGWFGILLGLHLVASVLSGAAGSLLPLVLPLLGFVTMLIHFGRVYAEQQARHFQPPLELAVKLGLILGHFFIGFMLFGILAAVLIPNLLGARTRASQAGEMAAARMAHIQMVTAQVDGTLQDGPCPLEALPQSQREHIVSCTVSDSAASMPRTALTMRSGRTIQLP